MNTTEKGNEFEERSLKIVKEMMKAGRITHSPEYLQFCTKAKDRYYSLKGKRYITFDITIEVKVPGADKPSLIYFIECKNYSGHNVPVDDVEEFHSKVNQVSDLNRKAIMISNASFSKGSIDYADGTGMMLIKGNSADDYNIILFSDRTYDKEVGIPYMGEHNKFEEPLRSIIKAVDSVLLDAIASHVAETSVGVQFLSKHDIGLIAENEIKKIEPRILAGKKILTFNRLSDYLSIEYNLKIDSGSIQSGNIGSFDRQNGLILLHPKLSPKSKLFVLAHEFGHFLLHEEITMGQKEYDLFSDSQYNFRTRKYNFSNPKHRIEWQANEFASSLIFSEQVFFYNFHKVLKEQNSRINLLRVDSQMCNIQLFNDVVKRMAYIFDVSKQSIIIKLNDYELIDNQYDPRTIGQIIDSECEFFI